MSWIGANTLSFVSLVDSYLPTLASPVTEPSICPSQCGVSDKNSPKKKKGRNLSKSPCKEKKKKEKSPRKEKVLKAKKIKKIKKKLNFEDSITVFNNPDPWVEKT